MTPVRRRLWLTLQVALAISLTIAVGWHFTKLLTQQPLSLNNLAFRPEFLLASALCYLAGHLVWGTFFWQLLRAGHPGTAWIRAVRAYYVSQVGKYAPGKVWVIFLRIMMLQSLGLRPTHIGVAGTFETLISMAAGAAVGLMLLPWSGWGLRSGSTGWFAFLALAALPIALGLSSGFLLKLKQKLRPTSVELTTPPTGLLLLGLVQASIGWLILAASLSLVIAALLPEPTQILRLDPRGIVAAVTLSYIAGFATLFVPGGLGARELLLQTMLAVQLQAANIEHAAAISVMVALIARLVWTLAELALGGLLWWIARPRVPSATELASLSEAV